MIIRYNKALVGIGMLLLANMLNTSCVDRLLDRKPLDQVSPEDYYTNADQLGTFAIGKYPSLFGGHSGWGAGMANWDNGTDNQAGIDPNRGLFYKPEWKVPAKGGYGMNPIYEVNYFLKNVLEKKEKGLISGVQADIDHYIGEAYFVRAYTYFSRLKQYGDFPIVDHPLSSSEEELIDASKRQPRNEVARFILKDLDTAIGLLKETTPNNQRISKRVALLVKSRVALYEATFEKYHRSSGRVPGDAQWPGKDKEWNAGKNFNQEAEVTFFLEQAADAAKQVAEAVLLTPNNHVINPKPGVKEGWNPYFDLFASTNLSSFSEVLLWRQYDLKLGVIHSAPLYLFRGAANGWTRGLVQSFLMKNGLPIYADNSGYHGDITSADVVKDRDERLQLFMWSDGKPWDNEGFTTPNHEIVYMRDTTTLNFFTSDKQLKDVTGYRQRKYFTYDHSHYPSTHLSSTTASPIFRVAEAYLNYIEASYLLKGNIDETAAKYWKALRERAGIDPDFNKTIAATDMTKEADTNRPSYDWAAFSAGKPVDATLYSIRRERRSEFAGEGFRKDDLFRWRALDQVKGYQIEGLNFWTSLAQEFLLKKVKLITDGTSKAIVSSKDLSIYLRPYQIVKENNPMFDGYTFAQGHYLSPFSVLEIQLAIPADKGNDLNQSNLYQNPGWSTQADTEAEY